MRIGGGEKAAINTPKKARKYCRFVTFSIMLFVIKWYFI